MTALGQKRTWARPLGKAGFGPTGDIKRPPIEAALCVAGR
jgi:hypothetical protein